MEAPTTPGKGAGLEWPGRCLLGEPAGRGRIELRCGAGWTSQAREPPGRTPPCSGHPCTMAVTSVTLTMS
jgi:hypothetical protein